MKRKEIILYMLSALIATNLYGIMVKSIKNIKSQDYIVEEILDENNREELTTTSLHNSSDDYKINVLPAPTLINDGKVYYYISKFYKDKGYFLYGKNCYQVSKFSPKYNKYLLVTNEEERFDIVLEKRFKKQEINYDGYLISIILPDMIKKF